MNFHGAIAGLAGLVLLTGCRHQPAAYDPASSAPTLAAARPAAQPHRTPAPVVAESSAEAEDEPRGQPVSTEFGLASWYGPPYHNRKGADGTVFDENALTAAHRELPMGTMVRVTNLATNESVVVKITDRGPFVPGRVLDLSKAAAQAIGLYRMGVARVKVEAWAHAGSDPEGRWCVQIGTFIDPADALQLKNDLARRYQTAKVIEFAGPTGHWVRINPAVPNHATAEKIADAIHLPDAEPYLIRTN
jgi:rare lipoprotein A